MSINGHIRQELILVHYHESVALLMIDTRTLSIV